MLLLTDERFDPEEDPELLAVELLIVTPLLVITTENEFVLDELVVVVVELDVVDVPDEELVSVLELFDDPVEEVDVQLEVSDVQLEESHEDVELLIADWPGSKELICRFARHAVRDQQAKSVTTRSSQCIQRPGHRIVPHA